MKTERVNVNVNNHFYPIHIGENLLQDKLLLQRHVKGRQVMVVSNETVAAFLPRPPQSHLPKLQMRYVYFAGWRAI